MLAIHRVVHKAADSLVPDTPALAARQTIYDTYTTDGRTYSLVRPLRSPVTLALARGPAPFSSASVRGFSTRTHDWPACIQPRYVVILPILVSGSSDLYRFLFRPPPIPFSFLLPKPVVTLASLVLAISHSLHSLFLLSSAPSDLFLPHVFCV